MNHFHGPAVNGSAVINGSAAIAVNTTNTPRGKSPDFLKVFTRPFTEVI